MKKYSSNFYNSVTSRAGVASEVVTKIVLMTFQPKSVIDIGAGEGIWSATISKLGNPELITAVDLPGSTFKNLQDLSADVEYITLNFENEMLQNRRIYDLAICVEVIEHISSRRALLLLDWISENCRTIVFSGATPGQGGTHHINEQHQSYWLNAMMRRGFIPIDNIRPVLDEYKKVPKYYRNNIFFFINSRFIQEKNLMEVLDLTIRQKSFAFMDTRNWFSIILQKSISLFPVFIVTYLAEAKSKMSYLRSQGDR